MYVFIFSWATKISCCFYCSIKTHETFFQLICNFIWYEFFHFWNQTSSVFPARWMKENFLFLVWLISLSFYKEMFSNVLLGLLLSKKISIEYQFNLITEMEKKQNSPLCWFLPKSRKLILGNSSHKTKIVVTVCNDHLVPSSWDKLFLMALLL